MPNVHHACGIPGEEEAVLHEAGRKLQFPRSQRTLRGVAEGFILDYLGKFRAVRVGTRESVNLCGSTSSHSGSQPKGKACTRSHPSQEQYKTVPSTPPLQTGQRARVTAHHHPQCCLLELMKIPEMGAPLLSSPPQLGCRTAERADRPLCTLLAGTEPLRGGLNTKPLMATFRSAIYGML